MLRKNALIVPMIFLLAPAGALETYIPELTGGPLPSAERRTEPMPREAKRFIEGDELNFGLALSRNLGLNNASEVTRGPKEATLFSETVRGVVLVISEDGIGSGALVTRSGHIVTNLHVVGANSEVKVIFPPADPSMKPTKADAIVAKVIKRNELKDLALLKIPKTPPNARPIVLSKSKIAVGDDVHAIGHPRNQLWSYTRGYVSQIRQNYEWSTDDSGRTYKANVIQTQTPINPGNSGGPLVNDKRELVGINSFKDPDASSLNYAVHVSDVNTFLQQEGDIIVNKKKNKQCGDDPVYVRDGNDKLSGSYKAYGFDPNCDGIIDAELRIPKEKNKPTVMVLDMNDDDKWDSITIDYEGDGKWDTSWHDTNYDGKFDHEGVHRNGEITPVRLVKRAG
jgi:S1-C subfamily serine protease